MSEQQRAGVLPVNHFDQHLAQVLGLPNGAHTDPTVIQVVDFYGNSTAHVVQTVKTDKGETAFITIIQASGTTRVVLPPEVLRAIDRQVESVRLQVRRRHGRRIAAERKAQGLAPAFMAKPGAGGRARKRKGGAR